MKWNVLWLFFEEIFYAKEFYKIQRWQIYKAQGNVSTGD